MGFVGIVHKHMDSASSGSIQSLSDDDGEDRYNSLVRTRTGAGNVGPMAKPSPLPPSVHPSPTHFNPFSNFFNPLSTPSLDNSWPRNPIPDHNPIESMNSQLQAAESNVVLPPKGNLNLKPDSSHASVRNPRKRARASRRAPTTVLTTDTSNFRAMVQEFTGIPAPPFTHPGSFPRARLDLFGGNSTPSPPNYLLRPVPQNPVSSIFNLPQPNLILAPNTTDTNPNCHLLLPEQSLYGNALPSTSGGGGGDGASDQALFRFMNGKYSTDEHSKLNKYSASSSLDFHADHKALENVTTRSEGIIESWIRSSD